MADLIFIVSLDIDPLDTGEFGSWISGLLFEILSGEGNEDNVRVEFIGELYRK